MLWNTDNLWVLDAETDGFYDQVKNLWCVVIRKVDQPETHLVVDNPSDLADKRFVGHNVIGYDYPVLAKLWGQEVADKYLLNMVDTMMLSQILYPDRLSHSLESYFPDTKVQNNVWHKYDPIILTRCIQDTKDTLRLFKSQCKELESWGCANYDWLQDEFDVAYEVARQGIRGCPIDKPLLTKAISFLMTEIDSMYESIGSVLGSYVDNVKTYETPFKLNGDTNTHVLKRNGGEPVDGPVTFFDRVPVRLTQHARVKDVLLSLGWIPSEYTDKGNPKLPKAEQWDEVAEVSGNEGLSLLAKYGGYKNRLDILKGWQSKIREDGKLTHSAFTVGTPTGRFRHQVLVNVPRPTSLFGNEMREIVYCDKEGWSQVGWDLSGIELRLLAHFMNDKPFIDVVLDGDVHTFFWEKVKKYVATRSDWKNCFYGYSYGAGNGKLGSLCTALAAKDRTPKAGGILRTAIETSTPSLGKLVEGVQKASLRGYLKGLDGRRIYMKTGKNKRKVKVGNKWLANPKGVITKDALNRLLQGNAAQVFKKALCLVNERTDPSKRESLIYYHDEDQSFVRNDYIEEYTAIVNQAIKDAGKYFNLNIPLDCDVMVGANWKETH